MRHRHTLGRVVLAGLLLLGWAAGASAQIARVSGIVKTDLGEPLRGATVRAENPEAALSNITAATDDKGRFAIIGLTRGNWLFTVESPGFQTEIGELNIQRTGSSLAPLLFVLKKAIDPPPVSVEGLTAKALQEQLTTAEGLYNEKKYNEAIEIYRSIAASVPSLHSVALQIAAAYRSMKDYDKAIEAYNELLAQVPDHHHAFLGLAQAHREKGDADAAEQVLVRAANADIQSRDVYFELAEVLIAKGQPAEATQWLQKAASADPSWGKPLLKLGTLALDSGDREAAARSMERAIQVDPTSEDAAAARTALEQLKR